VPNSKPPYPPEFRREALELLKLSEKPISQIAKDLGVSENRTLQMEKKILKKPRSGGDAPGPIARMRQREGQHALLDVRTDLIRHAWAPALSDAQRLKAQGGCERG